MREIKKGNSEKEGTIREREKKKRRKLEKEEE